jgi:hypothetical protein
MKRILVAIPHYFRTEGGRHGCLRQESEVRRTALRTAIWSIRQHFGTLQCCLDIATRTAVPANDGGRADVRVIVCTTGDDHLVDDRMTKVLGIEHRKTGAEPRMLGFSCHDALAEHRGAFDWYCYLEDDLIIGDPLFFTKLSWFSGQLGDESLLLPNRYEVAFSGPVDKAYIDGNLAERVTKPFQDVGDRGVVKGAIMGRELTFVRPLNPHAGCFFLNREQMERWCASPWFGDRDTSFIGPLESAATLSIMRAFRIYKPAMDTPGFLEIRHWGRSFLNLIGGSVKPPRFA